MEYSEKEKYLGHYITDDNSLVNSIKCDLKERAANVIVKLRNFINNHKDTTIDIKLKVFQACFCSCILSNCEIWGPNLPKELITLYKKGLKIVLEVRSSTPTAIIFMESKQPSVIAMVKKRQLKFWLELKKGCGTELYNMIERARNTKYIQYYIKLEAMYNDPQDAFKTLNSEYYKELWTQIRTATLEQSKLKTYHSIYNYSEIIPNQSLCLRTLNPLHNRVITKYITSSHNLQEEIGRWKRKPKGSRTCKQCTDNTDETILHFLFACDKFQHIRESHPNFPIVANLYEFFNWDQAPLVLYEMHNKR